ncbi:MAG: nitrate/sulfonate/bicarbonate ABC transporter ATP-binding protein [Woronichinia naegeliana WA131]|jgi:NitT/TauT family transport system ATP-binding protein|uniref:Nitrate/sulfonate/bicarbonate ABC transporter ATP-binding protein n=1 Tax=Woronichinia naegeliana WA131 TaxID=2824559 RepID=A0A977L374_9CYAN|nr:MAG: nitrate/sulfonate/bicarbonate ABC transporter ATP-binding protein [Woronichinia naegeliana WA131]
MKETLIALENVTKSYLQPNGQTISILDAISLEIPTGEIVALLGPSGSGKSTLMRMIAGLIPPSTGQIKYHQRPLVGLNPGAAIIFQNFALYPWLTVLENVELGLKAKGEPLATRQKKALHMIDVIGLDGFENAYPKELSGGMRQRVGFARALAVEPELLCMDEPFSALDVLTAENLRIELLDLWLEKRIPTKTILIVTHGIEEAVMLADRILILGRNPGRVRADFPIKLAHYRDRKSPAFEALVDQVYRIITNPDQEDIQPILSPNQAKQKTVEKSQSLPLVRIGAVAGFIELLEDRQGDLYRLAQELLLELDDIVPIIEAAKMMKLLTLKEGDIYLTAMGKQFIEGDIDERKHLIRQSILDNIRLVQQIKRLLDANPSQRISEDLILEILEVNFSPEESKKQLKMAIDWGRYTELFGYDEPAGAIYLEQAPEPAAIA